MEEIPIHGEMIRLGQLLKLADVVQGSPKLFLAEEEVLVNGEREERRGRQLAPGDVVSAAGRELRVSRS